MSNGVTYTFLNSPHILSWLPSYRVFGTYDILPDSTLSAQLGVPSYALQELGVSELRAPFLQFRIRL
jgi:hypothetical protein